MPITSSGSPILSGRSGRDIRHLLQKIRNQAAQATDLASAFQAIQEQIDVLQKALLQPTPGPEPDISVLNSAGAVTGFIGDFIGNNSALQTPAGFTGIHLGFPNSTTTNPILCGTSVALTAAQISNLSTTPVTIIPAQGGSSCVVVHMLFWKFTAGTSTFSGTGTINFTYGGSIAAVTGSVPATAVTTASLGLISCGPLVGSSGNSIPPNFSMQAAASSPFAGGNGTAVVSAIYSIYY